MQSATPVAMTDPATLPQWKGRPVPWVTKWSGETSMDPFTFAMNERAELHVVYPDGPEFRDDHGYLWRREGVGRKGEPQFAQVNAHRQRQAMRVPRCQVCGSRLPSDRPIRWLLPKNTMQVTPEGAVTVFSPPTCEGCVPLARQLCPHLRKEGSGLLLVKAFHVWGVMGEAVMLDGLTVVDRVKDVCLEYGRAYKDAGPHNFVVRNQLVALDDWEVIEE